MASFMKITNEAFKLKLSCAAEQPALLKRLNVARQDQAALQILVQSDLQYSVNIGREDWFSAKNRLSGPHERLRIAVDSPFPVRLQLEEMMRDDDEIEKADILLNQDVRESRANIPSAVWAEFNIPEDAAPGEYPVTIRLYSSRYFEDETTVMSETVTLCVADVVLPRPADWTFYLDLWQHTSNIARVHDVARWSDEHFAVLKQYAKTLADLGQKSITISASEIPWRGQGCYRDHAHTGNIFEYSMIRITRKKDGRYEYDYSPMQRYIDICTEAGINGDIEIFGLVNIWGDPSWTPNVPEPDHLEPIRLHYLDEEDGRMKYVREKAVIHDYIRSLEAYFLRTGQIERVRIAADEPGDTERYRQCLMLLEELAPHFRCKTAINHAEFIGEFHDRIDDIIPFLACTVREYDKLMYYRQEYPEKKFLWYVCTGGAIPNTFIRSPLIESRMIGILTYLLKLDGFLRWNYSIYPDDPRHDIRYSAFEAGDLNFVYPANNGGVLLSLRYKNLRRGIADFELLRRLREKAGDEAVMRILGRILRTTDIADYWRTDRRLSGEELFSQNWEDYNEMKAEVLKALESK